MTILAALAGAGEPPLDTEPWGCPVRGVDVPAPEIMLPAPAIWRLEAHVALQPDQPRDYPCNRGIDCLTASRTFGAGIVRGTYELPAAWSAALTLSMGEHVDFERVPRGGFGVVALRGDVQVELGRGPDRFGAALRVSPVLLFGWSDTGSAWRSDIPGFALLVGTRELWGEVIVPAFPTHLDPRRFYAGAGWRDERWTLEGGFATFGSLGYQRDVLDVATNHPGVWAHATWHIPDATGAPSRWDAQARLVLAYPFSATLGVGYRL